MKNSSKNSSVIEQVLLNRRVSRQIQKETVGFTTARAGFQGGDKRMLSRKARRERKNFSYE